MARGVTVPKTSAAGSDALEGRGSGSPALPQGAGMSGRRRSAQAAVGWRWGNQVLFLLQERSLELSSLVTPQNSKRLQIYYCIFPNLEGFHFRPHKRKKCFPFHSMTSIFLFQDKIHYSNAWKNKTSNHFPENSFEFCSGFSLARASPPPPPHPSKRNCLQDSQFLKDNDGSVFTVEISHVISLICNHS